MRFIDWCFYADSVLWVTSFTSFLLLQLLLKCQPRRPLKMMSCQLHNPQMMRLILHQRKKVVWQNRANVSCWIIQTWSTNIEGKLWYCEILPVHSSNYFFYLLFIFLKTSQMMMICMISAEQTKKGSSSKKSASKGKKPVKSKLMIIT